MILKETRAAVPFPRRPGRGFTLTELLVVVAIMAVLVAVSAPAVRSISDAGQYRQAISQVFGMLEEARSCAVGQGTYVWVVFYQQPASGSQPPAVCVGAFASNDGTDPLDWSSATVNMPAGTASGVATGFTSVFAPRILKNLSWKTSGLPQAPASPTPPGAAPNFVLTYRGDGGTATWTPGSPGYGVIQFTPEGGARAGPGVPASIWIGLDRLNANGSTARGGTVGFRINGLTGLTTVYRS